MRVGVGTFRKKKTALARLPVVRTTGQKSFGTEVKREGLPWAGVHSQNDFRTEADPLYIDVAQ